MMMIRRTTSMKGITVDLGSVNEQEPSDHSKAKVMGTATCDQVEYPMPVMVSPRYHRRRISGEGCEDERAHFLATCGLCNRRLAPGRDIYMYRGDTAFCSMECREQQMKQDERKEKSNKFNAKKKSTESHHNHSELPSANSETSSNNKTVAAA